MTNFLTGAPLWVWPLLALLIAIGLNSMRTRSAPLWALYALPLFGIMSLRAVLGLAPPAWVWLVFTGAYLLGATYGVRFHAPRIRSKIAGTATLSGEALTLVVVLVLFSANFVTGALRAVAPDMLFSAGFLGGFAAVMALASGTFMGCALAVWRAE